MMRLRWQTCLRRQRNIGARDDALSRIGSLWVQRKTFASVSRDVVEILDVKCGSSGLITVE